jgi:hypothetical protein
MKKVFVALVLAACAATAHADEWYVDLGAGYSMTHNADAPLVSSQPLAVLRVGREQGNWIVEFEHQSSILDGPPVSHKIDDRWHDRIAVMYRWRF